MQTILAISGFWAQNDFLPLTNAHLIRCAVTYSRLLKHWKIVIVDRTSPPDTFWPLSATQFHNASSQAYCVEPREPKARTRILINIELLAVEFFLKRSRTHFHIGHQERHCIHCQSLYNVPIASPEALGWRHPPPAVRPEVITLNLNQTLLDAPYQTSNFCTLRPEFLRWFIAYHNVKWHTRPWIHDNKVFS